MRWDFSLGKGGLMAVAAGLAAAAVLLFFAGMLVGAAAAAPDATLALAADSLRARDTAAASAPCPPPAAKSPTAGSADTTAAAAGASAPAGPFRARGVLTAAVRPPAVRPFRGDADGGEGEGAAPVAVFRSERRALALLRRMSARGEEAVIQAEAAPDGGPVFRVLAARSAP